MIAKESWTHSVVVAAIVLTLGLGATLAQTTAVAPPAAPFADRGGPATLRAAIGDLTAEFGGRYP